MSEYTPKILSRTQFGNPILNSTAKILTVNEIKSEKIQHLIADMRHTLVARKYGVGLAASQIGQSVSLSVILIRPTRIRKSLTRFESVIINPTYTGIGKKQPMWEGCLSFGTKNSPVFAQAMRYKKVNVTYYDEKGVFHKETLMGFVAHVFQHETDHLDGILFPSRVKDHTSWMNLSEYRKRIVNERKA